MNVNLDMDMDMDMDMDIGTRHDVMHAMTWDMETQG